MAGNLDTFRETRISELAAGSPRGADPAAEYAGLGRWVSETPSYCARPSGAHHLVPGRVTNGWLECSCGGHRTVRCLSHTGSQTCNSVQYLPALRPGCSLSRTHHRLTAAT